VVEAICNYKGVSFLLTNALLAPGVDLPVMLAFTIYSVIMVLAIVLILDVVQAVIDPRYRQGLEQS
jgi:ABC-type dipeptide/oligopeptide/nickel transport system permease component